MTTRYEAIGSALALADIRAGHDISDAARYDVTAAAELYYGGAEERAILAGEVPGYEGEEGVERACEECIRGYFAESA